MNKACSRKPRPFCLAPTKGSEICLGNNGVGSPPQTRSRSTAHQAFNDTNGFYCSVLPWHKIGWGGASHRACRTAQLHAGTLCSNPTPASFTPRASAQDKQRCELSTSHLGTANDPCCAVQTLSRAEAPRVRKMCMQEQPEGCLSWLEH